jgi:hypothetical protein
MFRQHVNTFQVRYDCVTYLRPRRLSVAIAQLGERKTEDLEAPCSIHGCDMILTLLPKIKKKKYCSHSMSRKTYGLPCVLTSGIFMGSIHSMILVEVDHTLLYCMVDHND